MQTKSPELNLIWDELEDIFFNYKGLNTRTRQRLERLGFTVVKLSNHSKIIMPVGTMIISNTPSDLHAGRQILRQIRRMYENNVVGN